MITILIMAKIKIEKLQKKGSENMADTPKVAVATTKRSSSPHVSRSPAEEDAHWRRVMVFLQQADTILDYLLRRVYAKRKGEDLSEPALYAQTADDDGPLTDELVVGYLEAIAGQARAGFIDGSGLPFFSIDDYLKSTKEKGNA